MVTCRSEEEAEALQRLARAKYMKLRKELNDRRKGASKCHGEAFINFAAPTQLRAGLIKLGIKPGKLPNTSDETLEALAEYEDLSVETAFADSPDLGKYGVVDVFRLFRSVTKLLGTYGHTWTQTYDQDGHVDPDTGRIHSRIDQLGAGSGRTSSSSPNVQNLPQGKEIRSCFTSPQGKVLEAFLESMGIVLGQDSLDVLTHDYAGCELRIMAELSGEDRWLEAFAKDWDVHSMCGEDMFGAEWLAMAEPGCEYYSDHKKCKCPKHKELRDKHLKILNFSVAYGKSAYGLARRWGSRERKQRISWHATGPSTRSSMPSLMSVEGWRRKRWSPAPPRAAADNGTGPPGRRRRSGRPGTCPRDNPSQPRPRSAKPTWGPSRPLPARGRTPRSREPTLTS